MAVDTLDDVVEEILDAFDVYGAHDSECCMDNENAYKVQLSGMCRSCAAGYLGERLREAAEVEAKLSEVVH